MNIEMPSRDERERSIETVIETALPDKPTFMGEWKRLFKTVGLKNAFYGVGDAVAAALLVSMATAFTASFLSAEVWVNALDASCFMPVLFLAPILYFSLLAFTTWKERMSGTWEVLAACRYNLKYITAIRVILVSAVGLAFIPIITLPFVGMAVYPNTIVFAFCTMFLYGILTLSSLLVSESILLWIAVPSVWTFFWGLLFIWNPLNVERFLADVPLISSGMAAIILLVVYLVELRVFVLRSTRRIEIAY